MGDVTRAIQKYIEEEIRISQTDISQSAKSREWLLGRIANAIVGREKEPVLYAPKRFQYFGSYFKGTKVKVVDEYDVLVVMDSNTGVFRTGDVEIGTGQGSVNPNHKYDDKYKKSDGSGVSPAKMLNWLKSVVEEVVKTFGGEAPEREGQAVTAVIKSQNLKIDLVPAGIFVRNSDDTVFYDIPRGDVNNGWIVTSPQGDIKRLAAVSRGKDNFRNVVRIAKRIKDTHNFTTPSFAVETGVVDFAEISGWHNDLYLDLRAVLGHIAFSFRLGTIADPYDSDNNLISGIESLNWYADRVDEIVDELDHCLQLDDQEEVYDRVRRMFENE